MRRLMIAWLRGLWDLDAEDTPDAVRWAVGEWGEDAGWDETW